MIVFRSCCWENHRISSGNSCWQHADANAVYLTWQGSGSRRIGSGGSDLVGSASRDRSAAVKSVLDELIKVLTLSVSFPLTISEAVVVLHLCLTMIAQCKLQHGTTIPGRKTT